MEVGKRQEIDRMMVQLKTQSDRPVIGSLGTMRSTWVFYSGTTVRPMMGDGGQEAVDFVSRSPDHFLIVTDAEYDSLSDRLPSHVAVLCSIPNFLKPEHLHLVGQRSDTEIALRGTDRQTRQR